MASLRLAPGALIIAGDSFLPHDPDGAARPFGLYANETRILDADGRLLAFDRFRCTGADWRQGRAGITGPTVMQGTLLAAGDAVAADGLRAAMHEALAALPEVYGAASLLPGGCGAWSRLLTRDGAALKAAMNALWSALRKCARGQAPALRRK